MTTNKNEVMEKKFYNQTFSFQVDCNAEGVQEIKKELIKFLQSKNWISKILPVNKVDIKNCNNCGWGKADPDPCEGCVNFDLYTIKNHQYDNEY